MYNVSIFLSFWARSRSMLGTLPRDVANMQFLKKCFNNNYTIVTHVNQYLQRGYTASNVTTNIYSKHT